MSSDQLNNFTRDRNRVELVRDFPNGCDPDHISSVEPHPCGWCVATRSSAADDNIEWTCIHDVQLPAMFDVADGQHDDDSRRTFCTLLRLFTLVDFFYHGCAIRLRRC